VVPPNLLSSEIHERPPAGVKNIGQAHFGAIHKVRGVIFGLDWLFSNGGKRRTGREFVTKAKRPQGKPRLRPGLFRVNLVLA